MKRFNPRNTRWIVFIAIGTLFTTSLQFLPTKTAYAESLTELQKQQQLLQQQAAAKAAAAKEQAALATRAAQSVQQVSGQISTLNSKISETSSQITSVSGQISQADQQLAELESNLTSITEQRNTLLRNLYMLVVSQSDEMSLFANKSISEKATVQQQIQALEDAAAAAYSRTLDASNQVKLARENLQQQHGNLTALKSDQQDQQSALASVKQTQQALQKNATATQKQLESEAAAAAAKAAEIAAKIRVLTSTSTWGTQIVSSNDSSWYYAQTGNYTKLGSSPYTINDYGCLITSIAMIATYYGNHITPTYIAQNGVFTRSGYLVSLPAGLGVVVQGSQGINWSTINNELAHNRPVIVSIYLPSVGAINSDGSSHFIVIKGVSNGKYLMHDPIGDGRGYNLNQVRSMKLVSDL